MAEYQIDEVVTYTLEIENTSASRAVTGVVGTDTFDATFDFASVMSTSVVTGTADAGSVSLQGASGSETGLIWTSGTMQPASKIQLKYTGSYPTPGAYTNNFVITPPANTTNQGTPSVSSQADVYLNVSLDLGISRSPAGASVAEDTDVTYTVTVTNTSGSVAASGISVGLTRHASTTSPEAVIASEAGTTYTQGNPGTWVIPTLAPGATATLQVKFQYSSAVGATTYDGSLTMGNAHHRNLGTSTVNHAITVI